MTSRIILTLALLITLMSCDFSGQIKDSVNSREKEAKASMNSELAHAKTVFTKSYKESLQLEKDNNLSTKATSLYQTIMATSDYIDSLRQEMDKMDNMDTRNVELTRSIFLGRGIGDSVFNKIRYSYQLAIDFTKTESDKSRLLKAQGNYSDELQKQLFEMSSPLGVSMVLFGFKLELFKDGTTCFDNMNQH